MGIIIKSIELSNWFSYFGSYEENKFEFLDGVNIIVAANDIGKSKLHNAFRWLLTDKAILKISDPSGKEKYGFVSLDEKILNDPDYSFFNFTKSNRLSNNDQEILGVKLTYVETKPNGETLTRILVKQIIVKKDVDKLIIKEQQTKVLKKENGTIRTAAGEEFEESIKKVIRPILIDFFLVQGESLEFLTPLKGDRLKSTINNLVNLTKLDEACRRAIQFATYMTKLRQDTENKEQLAKGAKKDKVTEKEKLEEGITELKQDILDLDKSLNENEIIRDQYREQAELEKENQTHADAIKDFLRQINICEGSINQQFKNLVENYINKEFWLSKITNVDNEKNKIKNISNSIREFSAIRRTELNDSLSKKEQKMLFALEKDQPGPAILQQMLDDDTCFVCATSLSDQSKIYIKDKLIPFFKNELNNDDKELNNLTEINEMFRKFESYLFKFNDFNEDFFQPKLDEIASNINESRNINNRKLAYINEYGSISINDDELVSLATYDQAIRAVTKIEGEIANKKVELDDNEKKLARVSSEIVNNILDDVESVKLTRSRKLEMLNQKLEKILIEIKRETYQRFASELEIVSNQKFKAISENNSKFSDQSIKVDFNLGNDNEPNFEIKVVNTSGHSMNQGGGASQVLRQLSVIFGLIDKAGGNVEYPFIADAPTDKMSISLMKDFFNYQLNNSSNQNILITKELWDDQKNELNDIGNEIFESVSNKDNARLIILKFKEDNAKRVEIINKV
jgi:DNA sulfur modification protein DndD